MLSSPMFHSSDVRSSPEARVFRILVHERPVNARQHRKPVAPFSGSSAIDANGNVYLIGSTTATNPVTPGAAQTYLGGGTSTFSIPMSIGPEPCSNVLIVKADSCGIEPIPSFEVEAARACSVL